MLKAYLDMVILQILEHQPMTSYRIDILLLERFHARISPSVTYAKLDVMERNGWIKCKPHDGKTYSLTKKGKELLSNKPLIIKEIHSSTITLFES